MSTDIKVLSIDTVFHRGTLNSTDKSTFSYEGDGLSVSVHPNEWGIIARLAGKDYSLFKHSGSFADNHSFDTKSLLAWGLKEGFIQPCELYKYTFYDENADERFMLFSTSAEAEVESEGNIEGITTETGFKPTLKMEGMLHVKTNHSIFLDHLFGLYVQANYPEIDGVWFDDELDVCGLSAPRGMIFPSKLKEWTIKLSSQ